MPRLELEQGRSGPYFSWRGIGGYGFDLGTYDGITFSGVIGYRALSVDCGTSKRRQRYGFNMLQHGPAQAVKVRIGSN